MAGPSLAAPAPRSAEATRQLLRHGSIYTIASVAQAALGAVTLPLAAWVLTPGDYGVAALVLIIALLFNVLAMAGLPTAAMRLFYDDEIGAEGVRRLYVPACALGLLAGAAAAGILLGLHAFGALGGLWPALLVLPVLTLPASLATLSGTILRAERRPASFAVIAIMRGGLNTGLGVAAALAFGRSASAYLAGYAAGGIIIAVIGTVLAHPDLRLPPRRVLNRALAIGVPTIGAGVGVFALAMADRFVVQIARPGPSVGRYQMAYAVGGIAFMILTSINAAWLPQVLATRDAGRRTATIRDLGEIVQGTAVALAAGCALLSPVVLPVLLPASYHPRQAAGLASVVALGAVVYVPYMAASQVLLQSTRTGSMSWIAPVAVVAELAAGFLLVGPFGMTGVAIASGVAYVVQAVLATLRARQIGGVGWLSPRWALASLPGLGAWTLGIFLPTDAGGVVARVALAAIVVAGWIRPLRAGVKPAPAVAEVAAELA